MKILHTSDWHIGHKLYGNDRTKEHRLFFDWLTQTIKNESIDVLMICGDIFDVGYPSNLALKSYYGFLKDLMKTDLRKVIITGGNHDFVSTLEAPREVLELLNVMVIGGSPENKEDLIITLENESGNTAIVVAAVPFLRDKDIRTPVAGESHDERIRAIQEGIIRYYREMAGLMSEYSEKKIPIIATGHLYMQGSQLSESERDIQLGNQAGVDAKAFPSIFSYYALGHIHRAQTISNDPDMVYSGSPFPLSFSEQHNKKSVRLIETENSRLKHHKIEIPCFREIRSFEGTFSQIREKIKDYHTDSPMEGWIEINVTEEDHDPLTSMALEQFVHDFNQTENNLSIVRHTLTFANRNTEDYIPEDTGKSLSDMNETEVFERLLDKQGITQTADLLNSFKELLEIIHTSENQE